MNEKEKEMMFLADTIKGEISEILKMVSNILKVDEEFLKNHCKILTEIDAVYYWNPIRGGLSIIVNNDGEKLVATSANKFEQHYNDFCDGKRN